MLAAPAKFKWLNKKCMAFVKNFAAHWLKSTDLKNELTFYTNNQYRCIAKHNTITEIKDLNQNKLRN